MSEKTELAVYRDFIEELKQVVENYKNSEYSNNISSYVIDALETLEETLTIKHGTHGE